MVNVAAAGGGGSRPVHHAVPHRGRAPVVHRAVLTAMFRGAGPRRLPDIPKKYRAKPHPRPAPPLRLPTIGKGKTAPGSLAVPVLGGNAYQQGLQRAKTAASIPHPGQPPSPYVNPFAASGAVTGGRIDQGVDYTGQPGQPIGALGPGKITLATQGSGWPGGGFIVEQLSAGPARGKFVYTAEDVQPLVSAGQTVKAGQAVGKFNQGGWIETGWGGSATQDVTLANVSGQSGGSVPVGAGAYSTGYGIAFDRLVRLLGGPSGQAASTVHGGAEPLFSNPGGLVPGQHHVSLPPAPLPNTTPHGVNPPASGGVNLGPVDFMAFDTTIRRRGGGGGSPPPTRDVFPAFRRHGPGTGGPPTRQPGGPTPTGAGGRGPGPTVTTITSSRGKGGIMSFAAPSTGASSSSGMSTLLLVAGAGVVLVLLFMRKGKGKGKR